MWNTFLPLFGVIFLVFGVSFLLINLRQVVTGNEFRGTCASNNPMLKNKVGDCEVCGKTAEQQDCQLPPLPEVK